MKGSLEISKDLRVPPKGVFVPDRKEVFVPDRKEVFVPDRKEVFVPDRKEVSKMSNTQIIISGLMYTLLILSFVYKSYASFFVYLAAVVYLASNYKD